MSYNISNFRLKSVSLVLPTDFKMKAFSRRAWDEIHLDVDDTWEYNQNGEGFQMGGEVTDAGLVATNLNCYSEGSGGDYHDLLVPLFKEFKGDLEASVVWEGGDTIEKVSIAKGILTETKIEI